MINTPDQMLDEDKPSIGNLKNPLLNFSETGSNLSPTQSRRSSFDKPNSNSLGEKMFRKFALGKGVLPIDEKERALLQWEDLNYFVPTKQNPNELSSEASAEEC